MQFYHFFDPCLHLPKGIGTITVWISPCFGEASQRKLICFARASMTASDKNSNFGNNIRRVCGNEPDLVTVNGAGGGSGNLMVQETQSHWECKEFCILGG